MKKSGIFWLIVGIIIHLVSLKFGLRFFIGTYFIWNVICLIKFFSDVDIEIMDYHDDNLETYKLYDVFKDYVYLYTSLLLIFIITYLGIKNTILSIVEFFTNFNEKIDNIKLKDIKFREKKKSFNEYIKDKTSK